MTMTYYTTQAAQR